MVVIKTPTPHLISIWELTEFGNYYSKIVGNDGYD